MENRAAVFTRQPQVVEVHQAGAWRAGELLGWRHDDAGACQMWVRVVSDGVEQMTWTELAAVRLPEPASSVSPPATQAVPAQAAAMPGAAPSTDPDATASLPLVRDSRGVQSATSRTGGRRRAPESDAVQGVTASSAPAAPTGRHRAPATAPSPVVGRHRAADTDHLRPVDAGAPATARSSRPGGRGVPAAHSAHPVERRAVGHGWTPPADLEPDLLTRPMRLTDQVPHARRPRVGGSVRA